MGNKDGPSCGSQWVPVLGSAMGGCWAPLGSLLVARGMVSSNEGHGRRSQVVLGCHAVHDGMVLLLGGDGDLLAVGGCSGSGW